MASLSSLPPEVVEAIAYQAGLLHPFSPPTSIQTLLLLNRSFYHLLRPSSNARLYAKLFKHRFDIDALERRFGSTSEIGGGGRIGDVSWGRTKASGAKEKGVARDKSEPRHEGSLVISTSKANPSPAAQDFAAATFPAISAPASPSASTADAPPVSSSSGLTARQLSDAFLDRIALLKRLRHCARTGTLSTLGTSGGVTSNRPIPHAELFGEAGMRQLTRDLWAAYLMVLENDGRNYEQLVRFGEIRRFLGVYYEQELLAAAVLPGYPQETPERALSMHIGHSLIDMSELDLETDTESEERFFVLKPYVFAAHIFDAYYAPWTYRRLPLSATTAPSSPPQQVPGNPLAANPPAIVEATFVADLTPRPRAQKLCYLGREIDIAPPVLSHAAARSFFLRVERDPEMVADAPAPATAMAAHHQAPVPAFPPTTPAAPPASEVQALPTVVAQAQAAQAMANQPGSGFTANHRLTEAACDALTLSSKDHDKDFLRLTACLDPMSSPGLHPLFHLGDFPGAWEGRFSLFDFDSYRDMLSGHMLSLYNGPFGDQPQVWKLEERVRRLRDGKLVRGGNRAMGMRLGQGQAVKEALARVARADAEAVEADGVNWDQVGRSAGTPSVGIGASGSGSRAPTTQPADDEEEEEELDPDEEYEIELQGTGHSAWGQFILQGKIRSWDGMFTLTKEYTPDGRGRWLYRGYLIAGGLLVGRWRDTFTPENLSGYEGSFLMRKRF